MISACLLPDLAVSNIIGIDFLRKFGIALDFANSGWYFASDPSTRYAIEPQSGISRVCCGLPELTPSQAERLAKFLQAKIPEPVANPGVTSLTE